MNYEFTADPIKVVRENAKKIGITELSTGALLTLITRKPQQEDDFFNYLDNPAAPDCVKAALELGRRLYGKRGTKISRPQDMMEYLAPYAKSNQERFIVASLNGSHEVINVRVVSLGTVNRCVVHPREVFADAITDRAVAIVVAHNHPSGSLDPSTEDKEITKRLFDAAKIIGISLLDHLIISSQGYCSFVERGLLAPFMDS
jgi:DNA repair protein RadC